MGGKVTKSENLEKDPKVRYQKHNGINSAQVVILEAESNTAADDSEPCYENARESKANSQRKSFDEHFNRMGVTQAQYVVVGNSYNTKQLEETQDDNLFQDVPAEDISVHEIKVPIGKDVNIRNQFYDTETSECTLEVHLHVNKCLDSRRSRRLMGGDSFQELKDASNTETPAESPDGESDGRKQNIKEWLMSPAVTDVGRDYDDYTPYQQGIICSPKSILDQLSSFRIFAQQTEKDAEVPIFRVRNDTKKWVVQTVRNVLIVSHDKTCQKSLILENSGKTCPHFIDPGMIHPGNVIAESHASKFSKNCFVISNDILNALYVTHWRELIAKNLERTYFFRHGSPTQTESLMKGYLYKRARHWIPPTRDGESYRSNGSLRRKKCISIVTNRPHLNVKIKQYSTNHQHCMIDAQYASSYGYTSKIQEREQIKTCSMKSLNESLSNITKCTTKGTIDRSVPDGSLKEIISITFPVQGNDIHAYPAAVQRFDMLTPQSLPQEDWQWMMRCRQLNFRVAIDETTLYANEDPGNSLTPVFPDCRFTYDRDRYLEMEFPRPLTVDHMVVHLWNRLDDIRHTPNMTVIHDRNHGSTFEHSATVCEGQDYLVTGRIDTSFQESTFRCTVLVANENRFATLLQMPAHRFKISDVALQTFMKHPNFLRMDTAVIHNGNLKLFMETFEVTLSEASMQRHLWRDQDILQMVFCLLDAVNTLHKNEVVHLNINDKTLVLKKSSDPTSIAIWRFSSAQFDSNKLIPLDFNDDPPKYFPPEWWYILQRLEYSSSMKKVDSWQIGCLMMKLIFGEDIDLICLIPMRHDERFVEDHFREENIRVSREMIQAELRYRLRRRVIHPHLKEIMFNFLEPCPNRRMSVESALALMRQTLYSHVVQSYF